METSFNSLVLPLTQLAEETNTVKIHWVSRTVCKKVLWDMWKEGHGLHCFHSWRVSYRGQGALSRAMTRGKPRAVVPSGKPS